jgi:4-amino-4-deoxy-L-arabinose transferase-like glycosyltransferase
MAHWLTSVAVVLILNGEMRVGVSAGPVFPSARTSVSDRIRVFRLRAWLASPSGLLALILLLGAALRLWMLAHDVPVVDSDEGAFGLMALHLRHGDWSVFLWGQFYMGTFETFLIAPFVAILGPSPVALRLAPMLLGLAFMLTTYLLASRIYSPRVGLASAALLAIGSPFFVVLSVRAYGGYVETLVFGNLLLLLALAGESPRGRRLVVAALMGLVAGVALWTDLLVAPYLLVAALVLWWQRRSDLRGRNGLGLVVGLLIGAAPAIVYNLTNGAPTLGSVLVLTLVGPHGSHHSPSLLALLPRNLWLELTVSLPILVGGFLGGTQAAGLTPDDYLRQAVLHPAAYVLALALTVVALALVFAAAARVVHQRIGSPLRFSLVGECSDTARVRRQGEAALLLLVVGYAAAFVLNNQLTVLATPRYLLPLFAGTPLLVAQGSGALVWLDWRVPNRLPMPPIRRLWLPSLLVVLVCGWNLAGDLALTPLQTAARDHGIWIAGSDDELLRMLRAHHVRTVISNDYWEGLRLTFESGETIITVMVTPQGHPGFNRYQPYVSQGLADPRPAYLELSGTLEASLDLALFEAGQRPGYTLVHTGEFVLLLPAN